MKNQADLTRLVDQLIEAAQNYTHDKKHRLDGTQPIRVGKLVKQLRETLGIDREEFARLVGVDGYTVYRWENDRAQPHLKKVKDFRQLLSHETPTLQEREPVIRIEIRIFAPPNVHIDLGTSRQR